MSSKKKTKKKHKHIQTVKYISPFRYTVYGSLICGKRLVIIIWKYGQVIEWWRGTTSLLKRNKGRKKTHYSE